MCPHGSAHTKWPWGCTVPHVRGTVPSWHGISIPFFALPIPNPALFLMLVQEVLILPPLFLNSQEGRASDLPCPLGSTGEAEQGFLQVSRAFHDKGGFGDVIKG